MVHPRMLHLNVAFLWRYSVSIETLYGIKIMERGGAGEAQQDRKWLIIIVKRRTIGIRM